MEQDKKVAEPINVTYFIPRKLHESIRAGTCEDGLTGYIQSALSLGRDVYFPAGRYKLSSECVLKPGQVLRGEGFERSVLFVGDDFDEKSTSVIRRLTEKSETLNYRRSALVDLGLEVTPNLLQSRSALVWDGRLGYIYPSVATYITPHPAA